jgi:hypothetical protein
VKPTVQAPTHSTPKYFVRELAGSFFQIKKGTKKRGPSGLFSSHWFFNLVVDALAQVGTEMLIDLHPFLLLHYISEIRGIHFFSTISHAPINLCTV